MKSYWSTCAGSTHLRCIGVQLAVIWQHRTYQPLLIFTSSSLLGCGPGFVTDASCSNTHSMTATEIQVRLLQVDAVKGEHKHVTHCAAQNCQLRRSARWRSKTRIYFDLLVLLHDDADQCLKAAKTKMQQHCSTCCTDFMLDLGKHAELTVSSAAGGQQINRVARVCHPRCNSSSCWHPDQQHFHDEQCHLYSLQASYQKVNRHATVKMMLCCGCSLLSCWCRLGKATADNDVLRIGAALHDFSVFCSTHLSYD
jgi:hypothetical protein